MIFPEGGAGVKDMNQRVYLLVDIVGHLSGKALNHQTWFNIH